MVVRTTFIRFARTVVLLVLFLSTTLSAFAQSLIGKVVDSRTQEPIIGAVVSVKGAEGSKAGAVSDVDGNFTLEVKKVPVVIVVSFTGYKKEEIDIFEVTSDELNIELTEDFNALEGVVVIGYGTQKKSDLAGAVTSVKVEDLNKDVSASLNGLLEGTTPGLQATPTGGQPGAGVSLRIRGGSSVQGGNEPLYVIDGFPIYNENISAGVISSSVDPLSSINPGDIESITVLKDASATAIYGSRGANGVIIITTKKGKSGEKAQVTYDGSIGWQTLRKKYEVLNGREFAELRNEALYDGNPNGGKYQYFSEKDLEEIGEGTDWQDAAYRTALVTNHQLSISGGTEKTHYAISGNYYKQDGILENTGFNRVNARLNIDTQFSNHLKVGVNATGSRTSNRIAPSGTVFALLQVPATATIYDKNGGLTFQNPFNLNLSNPYASLTEQTNKSISYRALGTAYGEYEFIKDLKLKISLGADVLQSEENSYIPSTLYEGATTGGSASIGNVRSESWLNENTLTYATTISKVHHLDFLLGYTQQEARNNINRSGSSNFVTDALTYNNLQGGSVLATPYSSSSSHSMISYLGRANYNYNDAHYFTFSIRRDGSSRFGKDRKWGTFPSAGYSWNIVNEKFFRPFKQTISNLKLRLSYGKTGNQEIGNYQSLSTLSTKLYTFNGSTVVGFAPDRIANNDLGWETTAQFDAGVDVGFFKDRLNFTIDYYRKKTTDLLLKVAVPFTSGYSTSLQNYGSVLNQGLEFGLNAQILKGKLNWDFSGNISLNRNKVLDLGGTSSSYITADLFTAYIIKEGQPLGSFYGAVYEGTLQQDEVETRGKYTYNQLAIPGDRVYKDINDDKKFTNAEDRTVIGNAEPDFTFGFTNRFNYKNFDLSFFFNGSVGNDLANVNRVRLSLFTGNQNAIKDAANRWTSNNTSSNVSRAKYSDPAAVFSSEFIEDGSYLRLKNITLGYTFPQPVVKAIGISGLRVFAAATNLLTFTSYTGYDPEVTSADNALTAGTDYGAYPTAKTFNFGVQVKF